MHRTNSHALILVGLFVSFFVICLEELSWAEVQPGQTLTKEALTQAAALLTPTTSWMLERGMPMPVIATQPVRLPKAYREATQQYAKQVELSVDGQTLSGYVAGCPFPNIDINDPLAGHKIMWNYEQKSYDTAGTSYALGVVDTHGAFSQTIVNRWRRLRWRGRASLEPKPVISHNPPIQHTDLLGPLAYPEKWAGSMTLNIRYIDAETPDDSYVYDAFSRRIRRFNTLSPSDDTLGMGLDFDSSWGFNGKLSQWRFQVLAEKDILAVAHSGKHADSAAWCAPRDAQHGLLAGLPCVNWEKRRVWVIEATPTGFDLPYAFSKRVLYIDQDFYGVLVSDLYDQHGAFWKGYVNSFAYAQSPYQGYPNQPIEGGTYGYEDEWPFVTNFVFFDVQSENITVGEAPVLDPSVSTWWRGDWYFNEGGPDNDPALHTQNHLIRLRH